MIIPRLFTAHVFLLPGLLLALVALHLALVWHQKHTQGRGQRATERNVVGTRIVPEFAMKSTALFIAVAAVLTAMAGAFQINPIWNYGPTFVSAGSQPDWYLAWVDGAGRLWPPWAITAFDHRIPAAVWPMVVLPAVLLTIAAAYPWIERRPTRDTRYHNILDRPRDAPVRTALGVMALTFVLVLTSGFNDLLSWQFNISLNATIWLGRIGLLLLPPLAHLVTYRLCRGLQSADRDVLEHGIATGIIKRMPHGEFLDIHQPLGPTDQDGHHQPLRYAGTPVPKKLNQLGLAGRPVPGTMFHPDPVEETEALRKARTDTDHAAGTDHQSDD